LPVEESPEFLQPVDTAPPLIMERRDHSKNLEMLKTKLFGPSSAAYFTYNRVTWRLNVRKEVSIHYSQKRNTIAVQFSWIIYNFR
jgi:hypothetical protein